MSASTKATAGQPSVRSALYGRAAPLACPAVKKIRQDFLSDFRRLVGVTELESVTSAV